MGRDKNFEKAVDILRKGGIAVVPTDTIYGIVGDATNVKAVARIYKLRRPSGRPFILLLPDPIWLVKLGLVFDRKVVELLMRVKGLTVVLKRKSKIPLYLTRGYDSLAVRIPHSSLLKSMLLKLNKPVVAPSVNPEGKKPAFTVDEAYRYFGEKIDVYIDRGKLRGSPSTIIRVEGNKVKFLREGTVRRKSLERILKKLGFETISFS